MTLDGGSQESATPRVSVIICTLNRPEFLRKAVASAVHQSLSTEEFEVIVVDNGPHESTRGVVADFVDAPNLTYVAEPTLGLSVARGRGLASARARYLAFLDDDAVASHHWLEHLLGTFTNRDPEPGCIGGRIDLVFESPRPKWLPRSLETNLAGLDLGDEEKVLAPGENAFGANMAFCREALELAGGFDESLGRRGNSLLSNEETLIQQRIEDLGFQRVYCPSASVEHYVPAQRLTKAWFRRRAYWQGISDARVKRHDAIPTMTRLRISVGQVRLTASHPGRALGALTGGDDPVRFADLYVMAWRLGYVREMSRLRNPRDSQS